MLNEKEVLEQSKAAFAVWRDVWEKNARINGDEWRKRGCPSHRNLLSTGMGKTLLCIGMGPSFEEQLETVIEYKDKINRGELDIACVDKAFSVLINNGVRPKWVFVADAGIDKKWFIKDKDKTKGSTLISTITANPEWAANWEGDVYFYVNKDNIESEKIYMKISGYNEVIPAGSNVGNAILIFSTQLLGYQEYLLLGYDYSWDEGNYYAFNNSDKRYYMKDAEAIDNFGNWASSSGNLFFSARWLNDFVHKLFYAQCIYNLVYNCSGKGFLSIENRGLKRMLERAKKTEWNDNDKLKVMMNRAEGIRLIGDEILKLKDIIKDYRLFEVNLKCLKNEEVVA